MGKNYFQMIKDGILVDGSGGGDAPAPVLITKSVTANGEYRAADDEADGYSTVSVDVLNSYTEQDEGKVVQSGALVAQTATSTTTNGTIDTTTNNSIVVNVANSYVAADEGKVVSNGALVVQGSDSVTENGTVDTTLISSLLVNVSGGGGGTTSNDVNFYDYDGTIVNSYSASEFAQLSAMPTNPSHTGLTAQGWNWSLSDAKSYVASYGKLNIGQMYITSDGKTRLYITLTEGRTSPILNLYLNDNSEIDVDWGDGTAHETLVYEYEGDVASNRHEYASAGDYVIEITVVSGGFGFVWYLLSDEHGSISSPDKAYLNAIKKVEIGSNVTSIGDSAFYNCSSLSSITIPNSVTSIDGSAFYNCSSLSSITISSNVTSIGDSEFYNCYSLSSITIPSSVTSIDSAFANCSSLSSVTIPSSVTSIGDSAFSNCASLSSVTIGSGVTSIGSSTFSKCYSLSSITIPSSVTSIGDSAFSNCASLSSVTIGSGVTSIGSSVFNNCSSLSSITIPSSVTSIGSNAFQNCYSLATITILGKSSGDISGAPWRAKTSSPTYTQIIWENDQ